MGKNKGQVHIVGAGCGKADLITVRGLNLIKSCDAVIYDDLIDENLLNFAPENAEKIYVGKRSGNHSAKQDEINGIIVKKALEGKDVVRLKGGDPFVFGRGGEEIEALKKHNIRYDVIPGISSSIAIPAMAGIPVTHRGTARSFHVITAHTNDSEDGLPEYMDTLAKLPGTLVFLMGLNKLEQIAQKLQESGMDSNTPAAVVSGGNSQNPFSIRGTLGNISEKASQANAKSPAVIVVGQTAALDYSPTVLRPLEGVKVALTGTDSMTLKLDCALKPLGADTFLAQRSEIVELDDGLDISKLIGENATVVFTSSNGVRIFFKRLFEKKTDIRKLSSVRFGVIGSYTGRTLESYGIIPDYCPELFTTDELGRLLIRNLKPESKIYLYRSEKGSKELYDMLDNKFDVEDIEAYTVCADKKVSENAKHHLASTDYICFSSAGGVESFFEEHGSIPPEAVCVCIGKVTMSTLRQRYTGKSLFANDISAGGVVDAILEDVIRKK